MNKASAADNGPPRPIMNPNEAAGEEGGSPGAAASGGVGAQRGGNYVDLTGGEDRVDGSRWRGSTSLMDDMRNYGEVVPTPTAVINNGTGPSKRRNNYDGSVMDDGRPYGSVALDATVKQQNVPVIDLFNDSDSEPDVAAGRKRPPQRQSSASGGLRNNCSSPLRRKRRPSDGAHRPHPNRPTSCHLDLPTRSSGDGARISFGLLSLVDLLKEGNALTCEGSASSSRRKLFEPTHSAASLPFNHQPFHYLQSDNWSCGFRNLQMLISGMLPTLASIFPRVPALAEIQGTMEALWSRGHDRPNAEHHGFALVGKTTWIGTVEVWSYLSFKRVDAIIVQFIKTNENRALLGKFVWAYFSRICGQFGCSCGGRCSGGNRLASPLLYSSEYAAHLLRKISDPGANIYGGEGESVQKCDCSLPPLYLQWEGHSVTVVGIRKLRDGAFNLLVFCPQKRKLSSQAKDMMVTELTRRESTGGTLTAESRNCDKFVNSLIELSSTKLQRKDCQVLLSTARIISDEESARRKSCAKNVGFLDATASTS